MAKIFSVLFLFSVLQLSAQKNLDVQWGPWGLDAPQFAGYSSLGQHFEDSSGYLLINESAELEYYDKELHKRTSTQLLSSLKDAEVLLTRRLSRKTFIVTVEKETAVKLYKFDHRENAANFEADLFEVKKTSGIKYSISPDSSKYVFYSYEGGKNPLVSVFIADSLMKVKWEMRDIPVQAQDDWFLSPIVSDAGDVAFADTDKENFIIHTLSDKGKSHKMKTMQLINEKWVNTASCISSADQFGFTLIYNKDNISMKCVEQAQFIIVDINATAIAQSTVKFDECLSDMMCVHLVPIGPKKLMLVTEKFATKINDSNNQCTYGAFNAIGVDLASSTVLWNKEIFKNLYFVSKPNVKADPFSEDYQNEFGHKFFTYKGVSYLFYGDNCLNCINTVTKAKSHSNLKNSCLAMVSIDSDGSVARHTYASMPNLKYQVDVKSITLVAPDKIIFKANGKESRFGAVKLNRK